MSEEKGRQSASDAPRRRRRNQHDVYVGERLRVARRLARVNQQELARHLGVSFQAVQKYESGENRLSAGRLVEAARFLRVRLAFFARDAEDWDEGGEKETLGADELDLLRAYRALPNETLRTQIRQLLITIASSPAEDRKLG